MIWVTYYQSFLYNARPEKNSKFDIFKNFKTNILISEYFPKNSYNLLLYLDTRNFTGVLMGQVDKMILILKK